MGRFSDMDARGLGPQEPSRDQAHGALQGMGLIKPEQRSDYERRAIVGEAGEAVLRAYFEAQGWTVTCPVQNNGDGLVNAVPGYLINGSGRKGLNREFVPLVEADEVAIQSGSSAFFGQRHPVYAPDFRLDKPGQTPRLIEVKTAVWLSKVHGKAGMGWRPDYVTSYRGLANAGVPIELLLMALGGTEYLPSDRFKSQRCGVWQFGPDALMNGWEKSPIADRPDLQFLKVSKGKKLKAADSKSICERTLEAIREAGEDPFARRVGSDYG